MKQYNRVLTIAGSDSGGGAGIQADIKTISALGCYAASAITALTAQNTITVSGIYPVSADFVYAQIKAVMTDIGADAIKTGMLFNSEIIRAVSQAIDDFGIKNLVVDPVMVATSGDRLLEAEAVETMITELLPKARLITPNIPEAEIIYGHKTNKHRIDNGLDVVADAISKNINTGVLIKGGHSIEKSADNVSIDILCSPELEQKEGEISKILYRGEMIETVNTHGTGCTLSAAIAAELAKGHTLHTAITNAKKYLSEAIKYGAEYKIGNGHGPVEHFYLQRIAGAE